MYETRSHDGPQRISMKHAMSLFEEVFRDLGLFIAMIDRQGNIIAINDQAQAIVGYLSDDITGMDFFNLFVASEMPTSIVSGIRAALHEGKMPERFVPEIRMKDGSSTKVLCSSDLLYDDGSVSGAIVYGIEMPDSYKKPDRSGGIDDRLRLYNDILSHDIKNYNQVALGYLEMALERPADNEARSMIDHAHSAIKRSNDLVSCIKKLIDIESGAPIEPMTEILTDIIDRNVRSIRQAYPQKTIEFKMTGDFNTTVSSCIIIDDAFYNVLDNAVRYDTHETVVVDIAAVTRADGLIDVTISDRGPGIPDNMKQVIFMRNNKSAHGWGMGLSITRAIVERLDGQIAVSDRVPGERNKGSVFTISLPKEK